MTQWMDLLFRILTSEKFVDRGSDTNMESVVRYALFNVALFAGGIFLTAFGIGDIISGNPSQGLIDLGMALFCFTAIGVLRTKIPLTITGCFPIGLFGLLCASLVYGGAERGFAGLWIYAFPLISIFVLGMKLGTTLSALLFAAFAVLCFVPGLARFDYTYSISFRVCAVYLLVFILTIVFEQVRLIKDRWGQQLTLALQKERDEITAMKDNLKVGLFLMNQDFIIQPAYSKALEDVLSYREPQGKSFIDLLAASIKTKELETLKDYFGMIFNRSFEQSMLDDINPLRQLNYTSIASGETRILDCGFAPVNRGQGEVFILATLQDITAEKELEKQLEKEESKRQEEMRSLFEVIQIDPKVFNDFIEDTEFEFERVNDTLKDKNLNSSRAMVEIYQSIHAVKSNALILGLEGYGKKLHALEDKIKVLRDQPSVAFEDVLHITVELEQVMREKDRYRETIDRVLVFSAKSGMTSSKTGQVLLETLARASDKAAREMGKQVRFEPRIIDETALESGSRRIIKEILTQLVRNSVFHGIEDPDDRVEAGKKAEGLISLSITIEDNRIHICLKDDGRGLAFEKIKKRALEMNLVQPEESDNRSVLLRAMFHPGFSTAENVSVHAGRGVGLSLVQSRLRELKGSVKVNTEPGKGTTFHIYLPVNAQA